MTYIKRQILSYLLFFALVNVCKSQNTGRLTSDVLKDVSVKWRSDSLSCKGYRKSVAEMVLNFKVDSIRNTYLFAILGKPNIIQKFYSGITHKNCVGYIYYVYKDNCPKIDIDGLAIQFIYDVLEESLIEITMIVYCG